VGWDLFVISTINGISCGQDRCPCIKGRSYSSFGYGNCLLFHNFMDWSSVAFVHFIELVYAADSHIS
jgi:hypothetical protein